MTQAEKLRRAEATVIKAAEEWLSDMGEDYPRGCNCHECNLAKTVIRLRKARGEK